MKLKYALALQCFAVFFFLNGYSQTNKTLWEKSTKNPKTEDLVLMDSEPLVSTVYQFNLEAFKAKLLNAPDRKLLKTQSSLIVDLPGEDGQMHAFRVKEASIMHPDLQARYPEIRSYVGESVDNPGTVTRFSVTPLGLHAMTFTSQGVRFINPYSKDGALYIEFAKKDVVSTKSFLCEFSDDNLIEENKSASASLFNANDGMMRTFRLALASTVEYSQFHWQAAGIPAFGTVAQKKAAVLAAMVVTMTRVNGVYERELSMTMELIANNDSVIFIGTDSYTNDDGPTMLGQNTTVLNSTIGAANYDIGHVFSTGGGGIASLNSPCTGNKARGVTGLPSPVGDAFDIDFVCHEMGHQYGAPHTFNGNTGFCGGNNREPSNAYEPGSGTTIMAYAGICAPQNVQSNSDDYFHQKSLQMIWSNVTTGASTCAAQSATGNAAPTAEAGANYTIPISTPYMLTGSSTDVDGTSTHTYTWEQYDLGPAGVPTETTASGPLVRSFAGTENPTRYIPRISDLLVSGGSTTWEKLVSVGRAINFRLTVRDNDVDGGQTAVDNMMVTTSTAAGPFAVTSQTGLVTWSSGNTETITWNVANTDTGAVNTPNVDILLSTDGGETFSTVLAAGVPNDGSHDIIVPALSEDNCLVMVKGSGNIFFNINMGRIAIGFNLASGEVCETFTFNLNETLTPNSGSFEQFGVGVTGSGIITDVNVKYDISSTALNQLHMAVISPSGTRAYLYPAGPCTSGTNMQITWDHEATQTVNAFCGNNPVVGVATPVPTSTPEPLNAIYGQEMNGTWVVMAANIGPTNMVFNTADLEICKNGVVATAAPTRVTQDIVEVEVLSTETVDNTHLVVTSPNTTNPADIQYTLSELPTEGTLYLNAVALVMGNTFTQADINAGNVTYTTTSSVNATDGFRVDVDDNNFGTLPNLLVEINIIENLSVDEFGINGFNIYPNPSQGVFTVQVNTYGDINLSLFDIRGRKVYSELYENTDSFKRQVDLGTMASGMYLLQVESGNKKATKKIIIE